MDEVVEKLVDVILRWSSVELRRGCGGFSEERWVLPPWLGWGRAREEGLLVSVWGEATGREHAWVRWEVGLRRGRMVGYVVQLLCTGDTHADASR